MDDTLQNTLLQKSSWLQRLKPETIVIVEAQLKIAQYNILQFISTTQDKAKIKAFVNKEITSAMETFETVLNDDIKEISELSYVVVGKVMQNYVSDPLAESFKGWKSIDGQVKDKLLKKDRLLFGTLMSKRKQKLILDSNVRLNETINEGFKSGVGIQEMSRQIKHKFGMSINEAKTLSSTAIFQAINEAQYASFDFFKDEIELYRYDGVSDSRQSSWCRLKTGLTSKNKQDIIRYLDHHFRCRSTLGVITEFSRELDKETPNRNLVEWKSKMVNHRDGTHSNKFKVDDVRQIPKDATPKQVFDAFNPKYQKEYLGSYKYDLYKKGKVDFLALHNHATGQLLTIDELKRKLN